MKASEYFNVSPKKLLCFNSDSDYDQKYFIEPSKLVKTKNKFFDNKTSGDKIKDFFDTIFLLEENGKLSELNRLLDSINEVKETHIGLTNKGFSGHGPNVDALKLSLHGLNDIKKKAIIHHLKIDFDAITYYIMTGVYSKHFKEDSLSDLITNIIFAELMDFTEQTFLYYGKNAINSKVYTHKCWDLSKHKWTLKKFSVYYEVNHIPTILIPAKTVVKNYSVNSYSFLNSGYCKYVKEQRNNSVTQRVLFDKLKSNRNSKPYDDIAMEKTLELPKTLSNYINNFRLKH